MDVDDAGTPLQRYERRVELPLFWASLVFVAAYSVIALAPDADRVWRDLALSVALLMWAVFAADYLVRLRLSRQRLRRFLRAQWLDTVVLILPLLRPLRLLKVYTAVQSRRETPKLSLHARVISYAGTGAVLLGYAGALTVYQTEHRAQGATIRTFGDALWWASETLTTVGYGDVTPVTPLGRLIAVGMMICGLALLGAVTGSFSSWLVEVFTREDERRGPPGAGGRGGAPTDKAGAQQ
ncbi:potassium channel family protein, partial [Streptomyces sp. NPDC127084]|uniref:potassium channel family protein n=1 Tax=Streptomyces sp. NPDC127084 TaxID=3347133 RepID=UPI00364F1557